MYLNPTSPHFCVGSPYMLYPGIYVIFVDRGRAIGKVLLENSQKEAERAFIKDELHF